MSMSTDLAGPDRARGGDQQDADERRAEQRAIQRAAAPLKQTTDAFNPILVEAAEGRRTRSLALSAIRLNFWLAGALLLSIAINGYLAFRAVSVDRQYFAADNGRILPLVPLSEPYRSPADVLQYAQQTVTRSFNLSFSNYQQQLEDVRGRYTQAGFQSFLGQLKSSGILEKLQERRLNTSLSAGTPVLTASGVNDGVQVWIVQMPVELSMVGQSSQQAVKWLATLRVQRIATLDSVEGIGVAQMITRPQ